ncbi:MAG: response regulator, partial [Gammaproteobacteria bacterium]
LWGPSQGWGNPLEKAGFDVLTSYRGDTGLKTWESNRPDLVLLDLNLPGMDGLDLTEGASE